MFGKKKKQKDDVQAIDTSVDITVEVPQSDINTISSTESVQEIPSETLVVETALEASEAITEPQEATEVEIDMVDDVAFESFAEVSTVEVGDDIFGSLMQSESGEEILVIDEDASFGTIVDKDGYYTVETNDVDDEGKKVTKKVKVKKRKKKDDRDFSIGIMLEEHYGDLLPYIKDINVTDINWNGKQLWIDDIKKGRYLSEVVLDSDFVNRFTLRVADVVSKHFNKWVPRLEAETEELRITVVHESVNAPGRAISIRKTPAVKRINFYDSIRDGKYATVEMSNILSNCVKAKMNVVICGLTGVGKTELVKYATNYIFARDRAITIEDTYELHYSKINPGKDCMELKVDENVFTYTDAIKSCLRLLPQWILLSEARSVEVKYLIETVSTGAKCITTIHTDDVRKIPDRVVNMIGDIDNQVNIENSVYNFFDLGILLERRQNPETHEIERYISQMCFFVRENGENKCIMVADRGEIIDTTLTEDIRYRFAKAGITDPFAYTYIP